MSKMIPFQRRFKFEYEKSQRLSPLIRRIVARNPNIFTFHGTNTYILGKGEVALVDPGPDSLEHIAAIKQSLKGETITHIFVTHTHIDHWPAAAILRDELGVKTYGYDLKRSLRGIDTPSVSELEDLTNQECYDLTGFSPDVALRHGDVIKGAGWSVESIFTPGHASNHLCYQLMEEKTLLSGDHVMGWSTSVISPPSGNMEHYMGSLNQLLTRDDLLFLPAHGPAIPDPLPFVRSFISHRNEREAQIIEEIKKGTRTIQEMVPHIYNDIPAFLHPAAERSVLAAVMYMKKRDIIQCDGELTTTNPLRLVLIN